MGDRARVVADDPGSSFTKGVVLDREPLSIRHVERIPPGEPTPGLAPEDAQAVVVPRRVGKFMRASASAD